ncbi:MAG: hypothetical protein CVU59_11795, partial [Deltaproteobacteria bacterium HGW-Deltaproteobacteria-17]
MDTETMETQGEGPRLGEEHGGLERTGSVVERGRVKAASLLPYVLAAGAVAIGGQILYSFNETLGLGVFALGIVPVAVTALVLAFFRPWVSVTQERIRWRYLLG